MSTIYFASTERLHLREQRESDGERLFNLFNDPRVQRTNPTYAVPLGSKWKERIKEMPDKALLNIVIEAKKPLEDKADADGTTAKQPEGTGSAPDDKEREKRREDELFVGYIGLQMTFPKNRDAELGIALDARWWGRGFGTEVMRWVVDYAFENLGLHRVTLGVLDGNERAIALYKSV
jgi:RimJ/RimL family protein N-acetyltransferase